MRSLFDTPPISVAELCRRIQRALRSQFPAPVQVFGEISRCRVVDGNIYFSLRDAGSIIACFCFRGTAERMRVKFPLADGLAVEIEGQVDIYQPKSSYQLLVQDIVPVGKGALHLQFELLKEKLEHEGLFSDARKRPIPSFIARVAIVTSANAAALQDFMVTCKRRGAHVRITHVHAPVQGAVAAGALARAIVRAGTLNVDVVVVARGGGSLEDLWAFNTEMVSRAIARCAKPVISAVGHQTDFTIADFVADRRVATPTAAAELVASEREALLNKISTCEQRLRRELARATLTHRHALEVALSGLRRSTSSIFASKTQRVTALRVQLGRCDPRRQMKSREKRLAVAIQRLSPAAGRLLFARRQELMSLDGALRLGVRSGLAAHMGAFSSAETKLSALSPRRTLERGYAIAYDRRGRVLTSSADSRVGDTIGVELHAGWLSAVVAEKRESHEQDGSQG